MSLRPHQIVLASAGFSVVWLLGFGASFQCRNHGTVAEHPIKQDATEAALGNSFQPPHRAGGPAAETQSYGVPRLCPLNSNCQSKGRSLALGQCVNFWANIYISSVLGFSVFGGHFSKVWEKGLAASERSMKTELERSGFDAYVYQDHTTSQPLIYTVKRQHSCVLPFCLCCKTFGRETVSDCLLLFICSWFHAVGFWSHLGSFKWQCPNNSRIRGHVLLFQMQLPWNTTIQMIFV